MQLSCMEQTTHCASAILTYSDMINGFMLFEWGHFCIILHPVVQPAVAAPAPPLSQLCHVLPVEAISIYIWIPQNSMRKPAYNWLYHQFW